MTDTDQDLSIRLAKRVADMLPCSRREAELYIEGGYVRVDGALVEEAGARVTPEQHVELAADATLLEIVPVTILFNKPAGVNGGVGADGAPLFAQLTADSRIAAAQAERFLKRHVTGQKLCTPLETMASGLVVLTQDFRVERKLGEELEQELIVDVEGQIAEHGLKLLNHGLPFNGKPLPPIKVSWQNETRLRFAVKAPKLGQIEHMCKMVGLKAVAIKRIRIGRIAMSSLPAGQWRTLQGYERF